MKKTLFAIAAVAALFASCSKEVDTIQDEITIPEGGAVVLRASVPESGTKVSSDNAGAFAWQVGDKVTVLNTSGSPFDFETEDGGTAVDFASATFTGTLSTEAFYPASNNHTSGKFYLDPSITWAADASGMPMLGTVNTSELTASFTSVGAVLKLICFNVDKDADKLVVTSDSKQIVGQFTPSGSPKVIAASASDANKVLTINFATAVASRNMVFYIPLPTGNVGTLTFEIKAESTTKFSKATKSAVTLSRNTLVVPAALNCAPATVLVSEDFSSYSADDVPSTSPYSCTNGSTSETKIWDDKLAGGTEPELLIGKTGGTFKISGIDCTGITTMVLKFKKNANSLTVTATDGITVAGSTADSGEKTITLTNVGTGEPKTPLTSFDLTFTAGSKNVRIDDVLLTVPVAYTAPTITAPNALTFDVGSTSKTGTVSLSNPVDGLGISTVLSGDDFSWVSSVGIDGTTLTVTATGANGTAADKTATLTLKATGATAKVITLTQPTALVSKPATISVVPGNASFSASWTKANHATGYKAYLHTAETATPAEGGTELTPSLDETTYSVSSSGLTNGSTYYLYVKVNGVDGGYIADSEYKMVSFVPSNTIYYEEVQEDLSDWSGDYLLVWGNNAYYGANGSDFSTNSPVSISDHKIAATDHSSHKITIEKEVIEEVTKYYIKLPSGKYLSNSDKSPSEVLAANKKEYVFDYTEDGIKINAYGESKYLYNQSTYYRFYSENANYYLPLLFKLNDPRSAAGLAWKKNSVSANSDLATMLTGEDTMPTIVLDNPHSLSVSYSSTVSTVATIHSSTGALTLVGPGTTVISAEFADGDATYKPQTVSYTLTVTDNRTVPVITLTTTDVELTDSNYDTFNGRSATVDPSVTLVYSKTDASNIIGEFNTSTGALTLNGNTGSATVTVSFDGNSEYKPAVSQSYNIIVASSSGPSALLPPSSPAITAITPTSFTATWTAAANASGYSWKLSTSSDPLAAAVATGTEEGGSTETVTKNELTLTKGTKYYFHIMSLGDGVNYSDSSSYETSTSVSYNTFTINAGDVVSGTSYQAHTATVSDRGWIVTFGGNNSSVGTNSKKRSDCNLSSYSKYAVSPVTTSDVASAFANTTAIDNVTNISYSFSGGSNQTDTNVYLLYSSAGSSFSQMSLSSGTQGASISSGTVYSFAKCSGYFAVLFKATNNSGNWRIDSVALTFTYIE